MSSHMGNSAIRAEGMGVQASWALHLRQAWGAGEPSAPSHKGSESCFCHETHSDFSEAIEQMKSR